MAFNLTHAVIHSFSKAAHTLEIGDVTKKTRLLDVAKNAVVSLATGVNGLLGKPGNILSYGQFGDDMRQGRFPSAFDKLVNNGLTDAEFLNLSHLAVDELVDQASKENLATGGRILVAAYESDLRPFLLVAMIKERGGIQLDEDYVPIEIVEIDLSKVYQAARINIGRYREVLALPAEQADAEEVPEDRTYLAFLGQGTHNQASGYFVKALGCTKGIASSRATSNVLKAVDTFFIDPELKPHRAKARFAVQCYLEKQLTARTDAVLTDIAHAATAVLADNQANFVERFKEFLNSEHVKVPAVFPVHAQTLKKSTKIKAESNGWSALFDRRLLGTSDKAEVYFHPGAKTLTFKVLDEATIKEIQNELDSRD
ncbi:nucleoid-associated protein [Massilia sp. NR 4-1]|uniref:nucleoid-associated protein n=1 Tax=Massilia sp. NR 4-1 TaxID=1678028 RepID=UPI00067CF5FA|nr:nucleoid-associated protein [Massilia sp. NR 4-1]AKU23495.1 hypothetical protein ACZ75_20585 [Massilia sp. NR 4-1]